MQVLKTISYNLVQAVTEDDFLKASLAATADLQTLDGFVERQLLRDGSGRWFDSVLWQSRAAADSSDGVISSMAGCASCISLMNMSTLEVEHFEVLQTSLSVRS